MNKFITIVRSSKSLYIGHCPLNNMQKGFDQKKIEKIRKALKENPEGLWIREIARKTKLTKSTVSKYINEYMKDEIEDVWKGGFIRIIRLKK